MVTRTPTRVSVVVPLYNGERFIIEALDSACAQTVAPAEIVVVDDGSTDSSPELVRKYAEKSNIPVRLLRQDNSGQSSARNHGINQASEGLIALLDQDDMWYPDHIEALMGPFSCGKRVGLSYSNLDIVDAGGGMVIKRALDYLDSPQPKGTLTDCLHANMYILPSASLMAKRAWEEVGGFDERLCGYEDDDLFLRIWRHYEVSYVDRPLSQWRIQTSSSSWTPRMWESGIIYAKKLIDEFPDDPKLKRFYVRDFIAPRFFRNYLSIYALVAESGDSGYVQQTRNTLIYFQHLMTPSFAVSIVMSLTRYPKLFLATKRLTSLLPLSGSLGKRFRPSSKGQF